MLVPAQALRGAAGMAGVLKVIGGVSLDLPCSTATDKSGSQPECSTRALK